VEKKLAFSFFLEFPKSPMINEPRYPSVTESGSLDGEMNLNYRVEQLKCRNHTRVMSSEKDSRIDLSLLLWEKEKGRRAARPFSFLRLGLREI
jgi:hypothetical protein